MYRDQQGVKSFLLDDDNCDCLSTLSMGHGLCGTTFSTSYGPVKRFVAVLFFYVSLLLDIRVEMLLSKYNILPTSDPLYSALCFAFLYITGKCIIF
jgi:hypothetical protein